MQLSISDSFKCYVSDCNEGKEFIEEYILKGRCYGVELQVYQVEDAFKIYLIPLPCKYSVSKKECDFYERAIEKLSNPALAEKIDASKPWVHTGSFSLEQKLLNSNKYLPALGMLFTLDPSFTEEDAARYKKLVKVE